MTRHDAYEYWLMRYNKAKGYNDPHWDSEERHEHADYVEALEQAVKALKPDERRVMTNREWLRTLTDEQLAEFLEFGCNACAEKLSKHCSDNCIENRKDWLSKKHKEDSDNAKS